VTRLAPPRTETGLPMLLAGVRRRHAFADAETTIRAQWQALAAMLALPGQRGDVRYGVVCASDPAAATFEYMCGVEVDAFAALSAEVGRMRVPAQRYAVFTHHGGAATLRAAWDAIWREWLPGSGERPADTPDFERYDPACYDAATGRGAIEIWFPVAEPGQAVWPHVPATRDGSPGRGPAA
jgi:AraC family transcriptional regulator